ARGAADIHRVRRGRVDEDRSDTAADVAGAEPGPALTDNPGYFRRRHRLHHVDMGAGVDQRVRRDVPVLVHLLAVPEPKRGLSVGLLERLAPALAGRAFGPFACWCQPEAWRSGTAWRRRPARNGR